MRRRVGNRYLIASIAIAVLTVGITSATAAADPPGEPVELSGPLGGEDVMNLSIVGGGDYVVYSVRDSSNQWNFYSVPIGGGSVFQLNPPGTEVNAQTQMSLESDVVVLVLGSHFSNEETWAFNVRSQTRTFIADGPGNETVVVDTVVSPDGKWVALMHVDSAPGSVTLYPTSGGTGITMGPAPAPTDSGASRPQFDPDSNYLTYVMRHGDQSRLFSYRLADGVRSALGPWDGGFAYEFPITIAPDSSAVVFAQGNKLRSATLTGAKRTVLYTGGQSVRFRDIQINATGDRVVFETEAASDVLRSAQIGVAGSSIVLIPANLDPYPATLSPDGQWAVLQATGLRSVPVAGGAPIQLVDGALLDISLDSKSVLFRPTGTGEQEVATIPIGGGAAFPLVTNWTPGAVAAGAAFYPQGGDVLYKAESGNGANLWRVTMAGGTAERLNVPAVDDGVYSYAPRISPDGQYVVYMSGNQGHEQHRLFSVDIGYRCDNQLATMVGTSGDDVMVGTGQRDVVVSLGGADDIRTLGGRDLVCAGDGPDLVRSGGGNDIVYGEAGNDDIRAGTGGDTVIGGRGGDTMTGQGGADTVLGGPGNDKAYGGIGNDALVGGKGTDECRGGSGTDTAATCEKTFGVP